MSYLSDKTLFVVDLKCYDNNNDEYDDIRWFIAKSSHKGLEELISYNVDDLRDNGINVYSYSYHRINETDNGYKLVVV